MTSKPPSGRDVGLPPAAASFAASLDEHAGDDVVTHEQARAGETPTVLPPPPSVTEGSRLGSRYEIKRLLGEGGMGAVYLARDEVLAQDVALKLVGSLGQGPVGATLERLRDEVRLAQRVTHPSVCRTFDLEEVEGQYLVKMEYVDGETLARRIEQEGRLSVRAAVDVARAVGEGLAAAHEKGVVHRDLKPANILLEAGTGRVVLMDFGIALMASGAVTGVAGTPEYMAPEQARGEAVDGRADLYALGGVLYTMLTGKVVFAASRPSAQLQRLLEDPPLDPRAVRMEIPAWLAALVLRLLEKDPARRFPDARAVVAALATGAGRRRGRALAVGVAALAAVAIGGGGWALLRHDDGGGRAAWRPTVVDHLPHYDENADMPAISPDGKQVAFVSDRDRGRLRVHVGPVAGGPSHAVTPADLDLVQPRWSADGASLLVVDIARFGAFRMPAAGGALEKIADGVAGLDDCGKSGELLLVFNGAPGCPTCSRVVLRGRGGEERELLRGSPGEGIGWPRCDGTRRQAVITRNMDQHSLRPRADLWWLPLDGGQGFTPGSRGGSPARQLTRKPDEMNNYPEFSADGRTLFFSSTRGGITNLYEMPVEGGADSRVTFGDGPDFASSVTPDGKQLLFDLDVTSLPLLAQPLGGGARRKLTPLIDDVLYPAPTVDGTEVVVEVRRDNKDLIVVVPVGEGEERILGEGLVPGLAPGDREVLFSLPGPPPVKLVAVPRRGGATRIVAELPGVVRNLGVGADGVVHLRLQTAAGMEAWWAPLAGGAALREAPAPWCEIDPAPVGGWRVAWVCGAINDGYLLAPGAPLEVGKSPAIAARLMAWEADGKALIYWNGVSVHRRTVAGVDTTLLERVPFTTGLAISPDGKTVCLVDTVSHVRRKLITNLAQRPRPL